MYGRNYTSEELQWGHVAPTLEAESAGWPTCCGSARAGACLGADSTCTAATFVSDGEVRACEAPSQSTGPHPPPVYLKHACVPPAAWQVRCTTPRLGHPALLRVRLSLNGQQYTPQDMTYLAYAQPLLESATPISGGEAGGSSVLLYGSGFQPGPLPAQHALPPLKPLIQPLQPVVEAPASAPAPVLTTARCLFGGQRVPASVLSPTTLRCLTPPATSLASARNVLTLRAATAHRGEGALVRLHGTARMEGEVLQLTRSADRVGRGAAMGGGIDSQVGFVSVLQSHFTRLPIRSFVLDCALRMGGPRDSGAPRRSPLTRITSAAPLHVSLPH